VCCVWRLCLIRQTPLRIACKIWWSRHVAWAVCSSSSRLPDITIGHNQLYRYMHLRGVTATALFIMVYPASIYLQWIQHGQSTLLGYLSSWRELVKRNCIMRTAISYRRDVVIFYPELPKINQKMETINCFFFPETKHISTRNRLRYSITTGDHV
jgi:hypothetical protein